MSYFITLNGKKNCVIKVDREINYNFCKMEEDATFKFY